ncbi:hypothetical protein [Saccharothrix coeruleofusca]|uniref:Uncharacterized protein n=1 Tax=Saccharothrix coeruleofusca TaxID=33919 RepID=A0A918EEV1_9PSEU|nr:hypothetical protein [Saccharothrix coeruleofusca]GGP55606.1 hypothetical protein GCM10010185_30230 [Saccharothrix coeruleofusca]
MKNDFGIRTRTSTEIDVNCVVEHEISGGQVFLSFADGAFCLHFTDEHAFRRFMSEAIKVLSTLGLST